MIQRCVIVGSLAIALLVIPKRGETQQQVAFVQTVVEPRAATGLLARPVSVDVKGATLAEAIRAAAVQADVLIQYKKETLDAYSGTVTVNFREIPLGTVLERVLAGTPLRVVPDGAGQLVVVQDIVREQGTIVGRVVSAKTKQPIAGATITVDAKTGGMTTGDDGRFRIPVEAGQHTLRVRALGFVRQERNVKVDAGGSITVDVVLEPSASVLDEVVVTGTVVATERKAIATPITVITAEQIEKRGITRIEQLFRGEVPGVTALDIGTLQYTSFASSSASNYNFAAQQSRVYSRGSASLEGGPNPLKTYVDGVELLDPGYLATIDPQSIERIEVITGPQAATLYGSGAIGGVMQIFTKNGAGKSAPDITVNLKYGMLQSNVSDTRTPMHDHVVNVAGGAGPEFSYAGSLSHQYSGQWQPAVFSRSFGGSVGATHVRGPVSVTGSVSMRTNRNGALAASSVTFCPERSIFGACFPSPIMNKLSGEGAIEWLSNGKISQRISHSASQTLSMNMDYRATSIWQHHLTLGRASSRSSSEPEEPAFIRTDDSLYVVSRSSGDRITANYNTTFVPRFGVLSSSFTLGLNGSWGDQVYLYGQYPAASSTSFVNPSVSQSMNSDSWGGFGSMQVGFWDQLFLTFGLRGERNPSYGRERQVDWTPTAGAAYTLEYGDWAVKMLGSYGKATKPPVQQYRDQIISRSTYWTQFEYVHQFENPELRPEYSQGPQGGIEIYYGNRGSITITHYQQTVTDLIQKVMVDSVFLNRSSDNIVESRYRFQYRNTAKVRSTGWEGTATLNLGMFNLKGTYSWNDSRVVEIDPNHANALGYSGPEVSLGPGDRFRLIPTHIGNVVASYAYHGTNISLISNYIGASLRSLFMAPEWQMRVSGRLAMYSEHKAIPPVLTSSPGYVKSDLVVSHRFATWATFTLNVVNVGNDFNSDIGAMFPSLGRQTLFGVSLRYPPR